MALARAGPAPDAPCRPPQRTLSQMDPTLFWYVVATVLVLVLGTYAIFGLAYDV